MTDQVIDVEFDADSEGRSLVAPARDESAIQRSDVRAQLDAAHRYPRSIAKVLKEAETLATMTPEIAASCMYAVPRGGKVVTGPSVRLAEIMASAWGNLQTGTRVVEALDGHVVSESVVWDMEKNNHHTARTNRRITFKNPKGKEDATTLAGAAGCSIALRNAIFRIIPRAYVESVYNKARAVAVGDQKTLPERRDALMRRFGALGVPADRVFASVGATGIEDIDLARFEQLIGIGSAIKDGTLNIDEAFPAPQAPSPVDSAPEGKRTNIPPPTPKSAPAATEPLPAESPKSESAPRAGGSTPRTPAQRAAILGGSLGLTDDEQRRVTERITGKSSRSSITEERFAAVEAALHQAAREKGTMPPDAEPQGEVSEPPEETWRDGGAS